MRRSAIFVFLLLLALPVAAQVGTPEPAPVGFPVAEITRRADELSAFLRELGETLAPDPAAARIREELPAAKQALNEQAGAALGRIDGAGLAALRELDREWRNRASDRETRDATLKQRPVALESAVGQLVGLGEVWKKTGEGAAAARAPKELVDRARQSSRAIEKMRAELGARLAEILTLQERVSRQDQTIADVLSAIAAARDRLRGKLLEADGPPLWSELVSSREGTPFSERIEEAASRSVTSLRGYLGARTTAVYLNLLLFVAALGLTLYLRPRTRRWAQTAWAAATVG